MSRVIVLVDGQTYESIEDPESTAEEYATSFYENIQVMRKLKFELKDGGHIIFTADPLQRAIIIVK